MLIKFTKSCHSMLGFIKAGTVINTFDARGRFFIDEGFAVEFSSDAPEVKEEKPATRRAPRRKKDANA